MEMFLIDQKNNMKIIINECYGGYGLSKKCLFWLIENKGWTVTEFTKEGSYKDPSAKIIKSNWCGEDQWHLMDQRSSRTDPDVIEAVETLGVETSSGRCSELKIVTIPDDVNWDIEEYDGMETVAEVRRKWS